MMKDATNPGPEMKPLHIQFYTKAIYLLLLLLLLGSSFVCFYIFSSVRS